MTEFAHTLSAVGSAAWLQTAGRFHVVIVHFPIALLLLAGAVELWRITRRKQQPSALAIGCLAVGAVSAIAASVLGWIHKDFTSFAAEGGWTLPLHQWLGIATAGASVIALLILATSIRRPREWETVELAHYVRKIRAYQLFTILSALLVSAAGHFGGTLTHGEGYLTELIFPAKGQAATLAQGNSIGAPTKAAVMPVAFPSDGKVQFARDVEPILQLACLDCHGAAKHRANLRLDTQMMALKGGAHGPALVPGKAAQSLIMQHIEGLNGKKRMPMGRAPLTDAQVKILKTWIDSGANWPATSTIASAAQTTHWSFVKPKRPDLPQVKNIGWCRNPIDYFVLANLEKKGLKPSPEADKVTLIRRVSLDLIGLPPTPAEVDAFVADDSPEAYDHLVNRLLASPHYGERWGRHWLDLAHYADTNGYEKDNPRSIWPYRDWVINALNRDMTFDQFVIDQYAGDMLPGATADEKIATGFLRNTMFNEEGGIDREEFRFKSIVDRVQTTGTALLGLTVHCAQCHNHKFDDISQKEYYQFFALLNNADEPTFNVPDPQIDQQRREIQEKIDAVRAGYASQFPDHDATIQWEPLKPNVFATSSPGGWLMLEPDHSLLATGKVPETDRYTIQADANLDGVVAFKLEALTDPSLPQKGPGRAGKDNNGNFVLSQFKVEQANIPKKAALQRGLQPPQSTRIAIDHADADYSQPDYDVSKSIDDYFDKGWAIGGREGFNQPVSAVFHTSEKLAGRKRLTISLLQKYKNHTLGKFRLSIGRLKVVPTTQPASQRREQFLVEKLDEWEKSIAPKCVNWSVLAPRKFERGGQATITRLPDDSLLFTGDNLYRDEYKLQYQTRVKNITAIRVEVLPDEHQPNNGPGRNPRGGFLLSEFTGLASSTTRPATTQPITFASASADVSNDTVSRAIDGKKDTHWTVSSGNGQPMEAVFKLKDPLPGFDGGTTLDLSIVQNYFQQENLGRVRISVTSDANAGQASGLPADVEQIVMTSPARRTPEQLTRLREQFLETTPLLANQHKQIAELEKSMPGYVTTLVMQERAVPRQTYIHKRGEYLSPTTPVSPDVLKLLPPLPSGEPHNRLALARWLVRADNPLVSRVVMNRIWSRYFGRGIVDTVEDFGVMGDAPSDPQLLDWLATEFVRQHWSLKAMHRLIVTSATYRQSSEITPELKEKDPENVLYARGPRFRVDAEIVRDIALSAAGLLSPRVGGPSVFPPQPAGVSELSYGPLAWKTSVGPDRYRRGIYTYLKRTSMYPMETTFDGPTAEVVCPRRARSNTPLQALTTLNDTVFVEAAQALARRVMKDAPAGVPDRATEVFRLCEARKPDQFELKTITSFYQQQLQRFESRKLDPSEVALADSPDIKVDKKNLPELAAWTAVARSILNLDETVTKE
jgi:mono/diheme cytochrome c family protein